MGRLSIMSKLVKALVIMVVAAVPLGLAGPAVATSCVGLEGMTPQNLLAGRPMHDSTLFEQYDLAVVGTVTAIRTNDAQGGATRTTVDVHSGFNVAQLPPTIDVASDDPGWMNGYAFAHGKTYFIPVAHPGPNGQPYYSFVCDPIFELPGAGAAADLEAVAEDNDVSVATISAPPAAASDTGAGGVPVLNVVGIGGLALAALLGVAGLALAAGRRRGASSASGSDFPA